MPKYYYVKLPYGYLNDLPQKISGGLYQFPCTPFPLLFWTEEEARILRDSLSMMVELIPVHPETDQ